MVSEHCATGKRALNNDHDNCRHADVQYVFPRGVIIESHCAQVAGEIVKRDAHAM